MKPIVAFLAAAALVSIACTPSDVSPSPAIREGLEQSASRRYAPQTMPTKAPTIIAHRGLHLALPENSKEAMLAGWEAGIQWCECDVHLSADGVAVVMHDDTLERTTQDKGPLAALTWARLRQLRLKNPDGTLSECRVPSLEELLAEMPSGCGLLVEIKPAENEKLVRETLRLCQERRVVVQSFDQSNVLHAIRLGNGLPTAFLVDKPEQMDAALSGEWRAVNVSFKLLDEPLCQRARAAGKSLGVWTVDKPADIRRALHMGVDRIITNYPERVKAAMAETISCN
jgi:glycerophosphoryl diester phosphodiesterase